MIKVAIRDTTGNWVAYVTSCCVAPAGIPEIVINNNEKAFEKCFGDFIK